MSKELPPVGWRSILNAARIFDKMHPGRYSDARTRIGRRCDLWTLLRGVRNGQARTKVERLMILVTGRLAYDGKKIGVNTDRLNSFLTALSPNYNNAAECVAEIRQVAENMHRTSAQVGAGAGGKGGADGMSKGIKKNEANVKARDYLLNNPNARARELAKGIGCSLGLVADLPAWKAVVEQRKKGKGPRPKALPLVAMEQDNSQKQAAIRGAKDRQTELDRLIDESNADNIKNPSPLTKTHKRMPQEYRKV